MYGEPLRSYWFGAIGLLSVLGVLMFTYFILRGGVKKRPHKDLIHERTELGDMMIVPPPESTHAFAGIVALLILELYFDILFITGVVQGFNQNTAALYLAMAFVIWGGILELYRREFHPYVLMEKSRKEKVISEREFEYR